jgi:hypothetical protein
MALNTVMLTVIYAECRNWAHYAECRYNECRGAQIKGLQLVVLISLLNLLV